MDGGQDVIVGVGDFFVWYVVQVCFEFIVVVVGVDEVCVIIDQVGCELCVVVIVVVCGVGVDGYISVVVKLCNVVIFDGDGVVVDFVVVVSIGGECGEVDVGLECVLVWVGWISYVWFFVG